MLHTVIREDLDDFLRAAADRGDSDDLPKFIGRDFREFVTCGVLAPYARWRAKVGAYRPADRDRAPAPSAGVTEAGRAQARHATGHGLC